MPKYTFSVTRHSAERAEVEVEAENEEEAREKVKEMENEGFCGVGFDEAHVWSHDIALTEDMEEQGED